VTAFLLEILLLAQAQGPAGGEEDRFFLPRLLITFVPIALLFYFFFILPQKKKDREYRELISNVKENDRVLTIGGIYGVVTNVQRDAERVTIRVDEATGTKLRVNMSAIARVLSAEEPDGGAGASKTKT
jgi:preprotein translocase subunit YajC